MRIIRYDAGNGPELGMIVATDKVVSFKAVCAFHEWPVVENLQDIIEHFDGDQVAQAVDSAKAFDGIDLASVRLLTPIPWTKRNIFCLGKNYLEHAQELSEAGANLAGIPEKPIYFTKTASPAIGPNDAIRIFPELTGGDVDYEAELAVIIGKQGVNIAKEDVESYIFGYTILNDVSARQLQIGHSQWFRGKCLDTHTVIGPEVIYKARVAFPPNLEIGSRVNGESRQLARTNQLIFDLATIISDLSRETTLYPGDIISTGTPSGVGMGFDPPRYLKAGDVVECFIESIGTLRNPVID